MRGQAPGFLGSRFSDEHGAGEAKLCSPDTLSSLTRPGQVKVMGGRSGAPQGLEKGERQTARLGGASRAQATVSLLGALPLQELHPNSILWSQVSGLGRPHSVPGQGDSETTCVVVRVPHTPAVTSGPALSPSLGWQARARAKPGPHRPSGQRSQLEHRPERMPHGALTRSHTSKAWRGAPGDIPQRDAAVPRTPVSLTPGGHRLHYRPGTHEMKLSRPTYMCLRSSSIRGRMESRPLHPDLLTLSGLPTRSAGLRRGGGG